MSCRFWVTDVSFACTAAKTEAMKLTSLGLFGVFAALLFQPVYEVARAQGTGPNRGVQNEPVTPGKVPETFGPATSQPNGADGTGNPALGRERRPLYRLAKSDVLEVSFPFTPEFNQSVTIQPDGFVTLREAGHLAAEGQTLPELEQSIVRAYTQILHDPHVTVKLTDFERPYFVASGEVARPGKYELRGSKTVSEALAIAGGFTQQSQRSQVVLFRKFSPGLMETRVLDVKKMMKNRDLREDPELCAGDFIYVPKSTISKIMRFMPTTNMGMYATTASF
jgi:polysaccharide biosynthesis/export protein